MKKSIAYLYFSSRLSADYLRLGIMVLVVLTVTSCATQKSKVAYYEDLTPNRPVFTATEISVRSTESNIVTKHTPPTKTVNKKVDSVLDSIDRINLTKKFIDGFTIQIYSGQKREEAVNTKQKMNNEIGDLTASVQYIQPKFRVTVGNYITRLEAQKDLVRLKRYFTSAILVPERILLK